MGGVRGTSITLDGTASGVPPWPPHYPCSLPPLLHLFPPYCLIAVISPRQGAGGDAQPGEEGKLTCPPPPSPLPLPPPPSPSPSPPHSPPPPPSSSLKLMVFAFWV